MDSIHSINCRKEDPEEKREKRNSRIAYAALALLALTVSYCSNKQSKEHEARINEFLNHPAKTIVHRVGTIKGSDHLGPYERPETYSDIICNYEPAAVIKEVGMDRLLNRIVEENNHTVALSKDEEVKIPVYEYNGKIK